MWDNIAKKVEECTKDNKRVYIWFRDDDWGISSAESQYFIQLNAKYNIPILVAVIPEKLTDKATDQIRSCAGVTVAQHGANHHNYYNDGDSIKSEFPDNRSLRHMIDSVISGKNRLKHEFPDQFIESFVPPWFEIGDKLSGQLSSLGFTSMSLFGNKTVVNDHIANIMRLDSTIDFIDWHRKELLFDKDYILKQLLCQLDEKMDTDYICLGILTHHQRMKGDSFEFYENLLRFALENKNITLTDYTSILKFSNVRR